MSSLQYSKCTLVPHPDQTTEGQLENHTLLKRDKIPYILKKKELGSVIITIAQITDNKRVLTEAIT